MHFTMSRFPFLAGDRGGLCVCVRQQRPQNIPSREPSFFWGGEQMFRFILSSLASSLVNVHFSATPSVRILRG